MAGVFAILLSGIQPLRSAVLHPVQIVCRCLPPFPVVNTCVTATWASASDLCFLLTPSFGKTAVLGPSRNSRSAGVMGLLTFWQLTEYQSKQSGKDECRWRSYPLSFLERLQRSTPLRQILHCSRSGGVHVVPLWCLGPVLMRPSCLPEGDRTLGLFQHFSPLILLLFPLGCPVFGCRGALVLGQGITFMFLHFLSQPACKQWY